MKKEELLYNDNIENDLKSFFEEVGMYKPSENFTNNILVNIQSENLASEKYSTPLISYKSWIIILSAILFIVVYSYTYLTPTANFNFISNALPIFSIDNFVGVFTISISNLTKTLISSRWLFMSGAILGIGIVNYYLHIVMLRKQA